ncbi:MAG: Fur family transcriptional regulator [Pseudomonadota bacterium]
MVRDADRHPEALSGASCAGQSQANDGVAQAAELCRARGVRLTALRQRVLELLWESSRPLGAYALIEALKSEQDRPVGPPTVYRALDFLTSEGFASKIESRNAYVACAHPERAHHCIFFICNECGQSVEMEDQRVEQLLAEDGARRLGFRMTRPVVEVAGTCRDCIAAGHP